MTKFGRRTFIMTKHKNNQTSRIWLIYLFCLLVFLGGILPNISKASGLVDCKYIKSQGKEIKITVDIASPPPATVIIIQNLPTGVSISQSSPPVKKFNSKKGEAKWLLKGVKPGTMIMAMRLNQPVKSNEISGEVRYMDPTTGAMIKMPFRP